MNIIKIFIIVISVINISETKSTIQDKREKYIKFLYKVNNSNDNLNKGDIVLALTTTKRRIPKTSKDINKSAHIQNGNRKVDENKKNYKILTVNKGNSAFATKSNELLHLFEINKPDVAVITESNLNTNDNNIESYFLRL